MTKTDIYNGLINQLNSVTKNNGNEKGYNTVSTYYNNVTDFAKFVADEYSLQKFENVKAKHIFSYVEKLKSEGKSESTIRTRLSAIRYFHKEVGGKNNLPDNDRLNLSKRERGTINKAWNDTEIRKAVDIAKAEGKERIALSIKVSSEFGLRIDETASLKKEQIKENSLEIKGKGGKVRNVAIETPEQRKLIEELKEYADRNGGKYILSEWNVKATKRELEKWIESRREEFSDKGRGKNVPQNEKPKAENLTFHGLRYRYAQNKYEREIGKGHTENYAKKAVSVSLGHERLEVTNIYLAKK
ncbi:MAG: site-specific integrase [Oscillospiraceae bacterium]|nr:site-specific integrase [Oscillospiraceae bacterium]